MDKISIDFEFIDRICISLSLRVSLSNGNRRKEIHSTQQQQLHKKWTNDNSDYENGMPFHGGNNFMWFFLVKDKVLELDRRREKKYQNWWSTSNEWLPRVTANTMLWYILNILSAN